MPANAVAPAPPSTWLSVSCRSFLASTAPGRNALMKKARSGPAAGIPAVLAVEAEACGRGGGGAVEGRHTVAEPGSIPTAGQPALPNRTHPPAAHTADNCNQGQPHRDRMSPRFKQIRPRSRRQGAGWTGRLCSGSTPAQPPGAAAPGALRCRLGGAGAESALQGSRSPALAACATGCRGGRGRLAWGWRRRAEAPCECVQAGSCRQACCRRAFCARQRHAGLLPAG